MSSFSRKLDLEMVFGIHHREAGCHANQPCKIPFIGFSIEIPPFLIGLVAMLFFSISPARAGQVTLAWNPSSGPVAGYRIYYGQQSKNYTSIIPIAPNLITTTTYTILDLPEGLYYFAAKAFDNAGNESDFSNEVNTTVVTTSTEPTTTSRQNSRLVNLSTRDWVGAGDNVMIAGFIIDGNGPKQILIRAIGPSMASADVPNLLYDPTLTLYSGQTPIASNNNWQDTQAAAIQTTGKAPNDPHESAILTTLNPGPYTAIVRGVSDTTGNALIEVYEINNLDNRLSNISTRGQIETGDNVMIAGFIIGGDNPKKILIRAIGPTLTASGVPGILADPTLTLYNGQTPIASNNNWQDTQAAAIQTTGKAPNDPHESAILTTLNPGPYTAIVRGVSDTTGNALVEVYDLDE
ncbi:MAG: hypothetical protein KDJ54_01465 [Candidatus Competibacteraceae bacterium]|nr:hypothetical protein [Candidatus Competibacteraceae bacterium]